MDPQGSRHVFVSHQSQSPPISAKRRFILLLDRSQVGRVYTQGKALPDDFRDADVKSLKSSGVTVETGFFFKGRRIQTPIKKNYTLAKKKIGKLIYTNRYARS